MVSELYPADYSIFVVDGDKEQCRYLSDAFIKWGFQVRPFHSGDEALDVMKKGDLPHVLLTDLQTTGLSGIGLAKRAKEFSSEIEIIFMTSQPSVETALEALQLGVHDYLLKPFQNLDNVYNVIFHVCERIYLRLYNEYLLAELKLKNEEIRCLSNLSSELSNVFDAAKIIEVGCRYLSKAFSEAQVCFFQYIPHDGTLMMSSRVPFELFGGVLTKFPIPRNQSSSIGLVAEYLNKIDRNEPFIQMLENAESMSPKEIRKGGIWKSFPFVTRSIPRGVFVVKFRDWDEEIHKPLANRYLQSLEKFFENALLHKKVFEMSVKDALTGLYNVRAFRERFEHELRVAERALHPLSLIFIDVDHFKKYNDTHGHQAGDMVLKTVANLLLKNFRKVDFVARYGGEEFCVILPHTEMESALKKAEAFRKVVEAHPFPHGNEQPGGHVSVSIGLSEYPSHAGNIEQLIKVADDALYRAKRESRNVVKCAERDPSYVPLFESRHVTVGR